MQNYHINIFYSDENEGWIADIPDLKHCSVFANSPLEALKELEIAKKTWIESAISLGKKIPKPQYKPAIYSFA